MILPNWFCRLILRQPGKTEGEMIHEAVAPTSAKPNQAESQVDVDKGLADEIRQLMAGSDHNVF